MGGPLTMEAIKNGSTPLQEISNKFQLSGDWVEGDVYGDGHINSTYKIIFRSHVEGIDKAYILQKINHHVFKEPELLMENIENVTAYLNDMLANQEEPRMDEVLKIIYSKEHKSYFKDDEGNYWRVYHFVENATGYTFAENTSILYEAGKAFGRFQWMLRDYPALSLHETIRNFHHTKDRYKQLMEAVIDNPVSRAEQVQDEIAFCKSHEKLSTMILDALETGEIPYRVTHNDTKINNVLIHNETGKGQCVIDLDTVMPGSALYDFGDAIRSSASTAAEDETDLSLVKIDLSRFEAYTVGFMEEMSDILTVAEIELMPFAGIIMTFECGMRFLTDYIQGDNYFRIHRPEHNLERARNQFQLAKDMLAHIEALKAIVKVSK